MKRFVRYILPITIIALLATGCSTISNLGIGGKRSSETALQKASKLPKQNGSEIPSAELTPLQTETLLDSIIYGKWIITEAGGKAIAHNNEDGAPERPTISFDSMAVNPFLIKFYAYTGCNTVNGRMALTDGGHLAKAGEFATTMRMCPDADDEAAIIDALNTAVRFGVERLNNNYILHIYNSAGVNTMTLSRNDMGFIDGAWDVTSIPPIEIKPDDMPDPIQLVFDSQEHKLHGNTGCNVLNALLITNPDKPDAIKIDNARTTRMACPNAGLEQQLLLALSKVASAHPGKGDTLNLLDEAGNTVITLRKASPTLNIE